MMLFSSNGSHFALRLIGAVTRRLIAVLEFKQLFKMRVIKESFWRNEQKD